jgi:hypothetical protein
MTIGRDLTEFSSLIFNKIDKGIDGRVGFQEQMN